MVKVCQHSSNSPTRKKSLYINRFLAWSPFSVSFSPTEKQNSGAREKKLLFGKTFCVCNDTFKMQTTYFKATESQLASLQRKEIKRMGKCGKFLWWLLFLKTKQNCGFWKYDNRLKAY